MNAVRAMLQAAGLDHTHWEDAARDAIFKYNLLYHSSIKTSPYSLWYGGSPKIQRLYTFGQLGTIPVYAPKKKMDTRADPARYMYPTSLTHIVVLNLKTMQYQAIRAIDFTPYHKQTDPTVQTTTAFKARASHTQPTPTTINIDTPPPKNIKQARAYPDSAKWQQAHDDELNNIDHYGSIKWLPRDFKPPPESVIPLMMHYRYKRADNGAIQQRKARCNLRGDLMKPGIHYDPRHTTTYTADRSTQRLLLALHATQQLPLEHFDIKSAYLHEKYSHDKPVYVPQMPKFDGTYKHDSQYGLLHGNLYGSPPAAYYYNHGLKTKLTELGYTASEHDPCLYTKVEHDKTFTIVSTTIDDFLVLASSTRHIDRLYNELLNKHKVKRLGLPTRFLNWSIHHAKDGSVHISQPDSIAALLKQTGMDKANPTATPYTSLTHIYHAPESAPLTPEEATKYRQILGEIRYITDSTRPDLTYATNRLAQHMSRPQAHHKQALKTILRYLQGTRKHGLLYKPGTSNHTHQAAQLSTFSDADFANSKKRKSITGTVHAYNKTPISWQSKMQSVVALSTTEAEYIPATNATQHTQWLRKLLESALNKQIHATPHSIDNNSAIMIAENQAPTKRRKYLDIRHHYLQHHIADETIRLNRIPTADMLADMLTKPLQKYRFRSLRQQLNIAPPPSADSKCNAPTGDCQTFE